MEELTVLVENAFSSDGEFSPDQGQEFDRIVAEAIRPVCSFLWDVFGDLPWSWHPVITFHSLSFSVVDHDDE